MLSGLFRLFAGVILVFTATVVASGGAAPLPDEVAASQSQFFTSVAKR